MGLISIQGMQEMCSDYGITPKSNEFEELIKFCTYLLLGNLLFSAILTYPEVTEAENVYFLISFSLFLGYCVHLRDILINGDQAFFGNGNPDYE